MANGLFGTGGLLGPVAPGLSGAINPLAFIGAGMASGNMAGALGQMGSLQQNAQQLEMRRQEQQMRQQQMAAQAAAQAAQQAALKQEREQEAANRVLIENYFKAQGQYGPEEQLIAQTIAPEAFAQSLMKQADPSKELQLYREMGGEEGTGVSFDKWYRQQERAELAMDPQRYKAIEGGKGGFFDTLSGNIVAKPAPGEEPVDFKDVSSLRKEYSGASKPWQESKRAFQRIQKTEPTGPGDIALITSYMKVLDPGSTVREGEFATARNAGGVSEQVRGIYNYLLKSGEMLSPEQRQRFKSQAARFLESRLEEQKNVQSRYGYIAGQRGMDVAEAVPDYLGEFADPGYIEEMIQTPIMPPQPGTSIDPQAEVPMTPELEAFMSEYGS